MAPESNSSHEVMLSMWLIQVKNLFIKPRSDDDTITVNFSPHAACFVALLQHESEIYCTNSVPLLFDYVDSSPQSHQQLRLKVQNSRKQDQPELSESAGPDLLTEKINLYLLMEQESHKKKQLPLANSSWSPSEICFVFFKEMNTIHLNFPRLRFWTPQFM